MIVGCCTLMCCATSLLSNVMSVNLAAIRQTYGISGTSTSLILTMRSLSAFLAALVSAKYFKHFGLKFGMFIAMLFGAAAFALFALADGNLILYYAGGISSGIAYSYGLMLPASMLIKSWFNRNRGTALSIASCGTGLSSVVFSPIVQKAVLSYGIRSAFIIQGSFTLFVAVIILLLVVDSPESLGFQPLGRESDIEISSSRTSLPYSPLNGSQYIFVFIAVLLVGMSTSPASAHFSLAYTTEGLDPMPVAVGMSVYGFAVIVSKFLFGKSVDRLGARKTTIVFELLLIASFLCIFLVRWINTIPWMFMSTGIVGIGIAVQTLGYPNWVADLDPENYRRSMSRCQICYQAGALIGSIIPGFIFDMTGSYVWAYLMFAVCCVIVLCIISKVYRSNSIKAC